MKFETFLEGFYLIYKLLPPKSIWQLMNFSFLIHHILKVFWTYDKIIVSHITFHVLSNAKEEIL